MILTIIDMAGYKTAIKKAINESTSNVRVLKVDGIDKSVQGLDESIETWFIEVTVKKLKRKKK